MSLFPQRWAQKTVIVAASGPSLPLTVPISADRHILLVVNSTYQRFLNAHVLYAGDHLWWKGMHADVFARFKGEKWTQDSTSAERYKLNRIKGINKTGLGHQFIHLNGNSGFQAINLAFLFGARRMLLIGFDMKLGPNGEKHWHPDHPAPMVQGQTFGEWMHKGATLAKDLAAAGCEVINCTPGSAMSCFPMGTLEKEL
jgi:hypothetical protein